MAYCATNKENCIEWQTGQETITLSLTQERMINKVRKLKKKFPDDVKIKTNKDGSIYAKMPLSFLKLNHVQREAKEMSDAEKKELTKRLRAGKKAQAQNSDWN